MWQVAKVLNELLADEVIRNYAIFGAIAQVRYTEAVATLDVDTLVVVRIRSGSTCFPGYGRRKDNERVSLLLESGSTTVDDIGRLASKYGMEHQWTEFRKRFLDGR